MVFCMLRLSDDTTSAALGEAFCLGLGGLEWKVWVDRPC